MKLAIAQMVLGVLIVVILCHLRGYLRGYLFFWGVSYLDFIIPLLLGLSVLGCGIAQYLKAREARS